MKHTIYLFILNSNLNDEGNFSKNSLFFDQVFLHLYRDHCLLYSNLKLTFLFLKEIKIKSMNLNWNFL